MEENKELTEDYGSCTGVKPICPTGTSLKCVNGEWVCQGVAEEETQKDVDNDRK